MLLRFILLTGFYLPLLANGSSVKASLFGFSRKDATSCLQSAMDSRSDTVYVDNVGIWNVAPVFVNQNNKTIILENGVLLMALSERYDINDCVLNISANAINPNIRKNITIIGYGATIQMRKHEYLEKINGEFRHCLTIDNADNIKIFGLTLRDSGGDGIILGNASPSNLQGVNFNKDIIIKDCRCINNKRQGISIISAINVLVENCVLEATSGTAPSSGIDIEPDVEHEFIYNCTIRNCLIQNNRGNGLQVYVPHASPKLHPISVSIENCVIKGNQQNGLYVFGPGKSEGESVISISGCLVVNNNGGIELANTSTGNIKVEKCFFMNSGKASNYIVTIDQGYNSFLVRPGQLFGGIEFLNCSVVPGAQNIFTSKPDRSNLFRGVRAIRGKIFVVDTSNAKRIEKDNFSIRLDVLTKMDIDAKVTVLDSRIQSNEGLAIVRFLPFKPLAPLNAAIKVVDQSGDIFEQVISIEDCLAGFTSVDLSLFKYKANTLTLTVSEWEHVGYRKVFNQIEL